MRSTLLLCLFAVLSCKLINVIDDAECIIKNAKAANAVVEIFDHIKRKQYTSIPKLLHKDFAELQKVSEKCLKPVEVDDALLKANPQLEVCLRGCLGKKLCIELCFKKYK